MCPSLSRADSLIKSQHRRFLLPLVVHTLTIKLLLYTGADFPRKTTMTTTRVFFGVPRHKKWKMSCKDARLFIGITTQQRRKNTHHHFQCAQFSGKIAQIKRLRFSICSEKIKTRCWWWNGLRCSLRQSSKTASYVFREICLAANSDVVQDSQERAQLI